MTKKCVECGSTKNLQRGWTNCWYCSEICEIKGVSRVHGSMPGAGPVPHHNWVPYNISVKIAERWKDYE